MRRVSISGGNDHGQSTTGEADGRVVLMQVETSFRILGYPGFAILFFVLAACGAVALILTVFLEDE